MARGGRGDRARPHLPGGRLDIVGAMPVDITWRGPFDNAEVNALHAEAFEHRPADDDWEGLTQRHSLGWAIARQGGALVGFINVLWDGACHAFIEDLMVGQAVRRQGIGMRLVAAAREGAREAGCDWLHVDFDEANRAFYIVACGFSPTGSGLIALR